MIRFVLTIWLLLLTTSVFGEEELFTSKYSGELSGYHIVSTRTLTLLDDGTYRFESIAKHTIGSITETSDFKLVNCEIYPLRYHYRRSIIGFKKEESIEFDWDKNKAIYRRKGKSEKTFVHDLVPGLLETSVYQLALQRDAWLSAGKFDKGKTDYSIISHKKIKNMSFSLLGKEQINIGTKEYQAIKIQLNHPGSAKVTSAWLVPDLNYQIGKIVQEDEDGDTYEIKLESYHASKTIFNAIYPELPKTE